jgi:hypothetical protein
VAEKTGAYTAQVVTLALQIGLAVLIGKTHGFLASHSVAKHGPMKQARKAKLSGVGV